jgi:hypothetical protein
LVLTAKDVIQLVVNLLQEVLAEAHHLSHQSLFWF